MGYVIFFVGTFAVLLTSIFFYPKKNNQIGIVQNFVMSYITLLCLGAVVAEILSLLKISINIRSMAVIWLGLGILVWGDIIFLKKEMQKMTVQDVYGVTILTIFFIILFVKIFTFDFNWVYETTDPSSHFIMAQEVMKTGTINAMYFTALYNGLFMQLFEPFVNEIAMNKVFILSDSWFNYINLLMCYMWMRSACRQPKMKWIIPFLCMLYFIGWPLSSYAQYGFIYFGVGVTLCAYIVYFIYAWENISLRNWMKYTLVALGIFSLTVCYMLFVPVVVLALCIYFIMRSDIIFHFKKMLKFIPIILCMGIIVFGIAYFGYFHGDASSIFVSLKLEGNIHACLFEDFIFIMPLAIYAAGREWKNYNIVVIAWGITGAFSIIAVGMVCMDLMSGYYCYKLYYPMWLWCWILLAIAVDYLLQNNKLILLSMTIPVLFTLTIMWTGFERRMPDNLGNVNVEGLFPIYSESRRLIYEPDEYTINDRAAVRQLAAYIKDNFNADESVPMIYGHRVYHIGKVWYLALTGNESYDYSIEDGLIPILKQIDNDNYYFAISMEVVDANTEILKDYNQIYSENGYAIYETNKK